MLTIAATYASPNDAEWTRLHLQALGFGPTGVELTVRASSTEAQTRRLLERAGLSASMAAHYARLVERGETLLLAEVGTPALRETAELAIATYAQMPDLIGEIRETTTSTAKLAELRARIAASSPASRPQAKTARA
jgi:hypothetical protein